MRYIRQVDWRKSETLVRLGILIVVISAIVAALLYAGGSFDLGWQVAVAFLLGASCSVAAGFSGMRAATSANGRTAMAAADGGQSAALQTAYNGGAVMGLAVGGLGLLGISVMYLWLGDDLDSVGYMAGFGMGASSIALFARVGGGIFTKAADVGADLVGKIEAGIPEDDPRNPGVIADNVGDNVGDVAGMGADIFESFVGSMIAAMVIAAASSSLGADYVLIPLLLALVGYLASIIGVFSMYVFKGGNAAAALRNTTFVGAGLLIVGGYLTLNHFGLPVEPLYAVGIGAAVGIAIGQLGAMGRWEMILPFKKIIAVHIAVDVEVTDAARRDDGSHVRGKGHPRIGRLKHVHVHTRTERRC